MSEINNIKPPLKPDIGLSRETTATERKSRADTSVTSSSSSSADTKADRVSLSDTLALMEQKLAQVPIVDASRVEATKLAIKDGSYTIDSQELARKMIGFEGDL